MAEVRIIVPGRGEGEALPDALRRLTAALAGRDEDSDDFGGLGGEHGYGCDYEDDLFMMHRYCWCEREDCPWCGGCAGDIPDSVHAGDCYQAHRNALKEKYGRIYGERDEWGWRVPWDCAPFNEAEEALCREMGLDPRRGSAVHCTCGAREQWKRDYDDCDCDWHRGRGPFRFGPAAEAPNFWHKPSDLWVRWYKWIGRGMEIENPSGVDPVEVVEECISGVEQPAAVTERGVPGESQELASEDAGNGANPDD